MFAFKKKKTPCQLALVSTLGFDITIEFLCILWNSLNVNSLIVDSETMSFVHTEKQNETWNSLNLNWLNFVGICQITL